MVAFGFGVYRVAGMLKSDGTPRAASRARPSAPALPGTMFVAQQAARSTGFKDGAFTQITDEAGWTQPSSSPDGTQLVAVQRRQNYSDVYLLTSTRSHRPAADAPAVAGGRGQPLGVLPRFSADGTRIFFSYDDKDPCHL